MTRKIEENKAIALHETSGIRNPYGVMDVPNPNDQEVVEFAAGANLDGSTDDENESAWGYYERGRRTPRHRRNLV
jgi:hypothetical protein